MNALKTIQSTFPLQTQYFSQQRAVTRRKRSTLCFTNTDETGSDPDPDPSQGDRHKQELLAQIMMIQTKKVRLTEFLDERSTYMTQITEDANAKFDEIGENALKELDEAGTRIMDKLESRVQSFEEAAEINRQEIEKNEKVLEDFEEQIAKDRNEGLFFKNLQEKNPERKLQEKAEASKLQEVTRANVGSGIRINIYLALIALLLVIGTGSAVFTSPDQVDWQKAAALGLILIGLLARFIHEQSLSSTSEEQDDKKR